MQKEESLHHQTIGGAFYKALYRGKDGGTKGEHRGSTREEEERKEVTLGGSSIYPGREEGKLTY